MGAEAVADGLEGQLLDGSSVVSSAAPLPGGLEQG